MTLSSYWDIFCRVIDNHGDLGVSWRLARQLADRGIPVRLWLDDPSALRWMAPGGHPGVQVQNWTPSFNWSQMVPGQVLVETFGCEVPEAYVELFVSPLGASQRAWINLEYLSAQSYVERSHGLPSPVLTGAGQGLTKYFFYPGFTARTGGLLREPDLMARQARFSRDTWLSSQGIEIAPGKRLVSLFCYEPDCLPEVLAQLASEPSHLLVTAGRAASWVRSCPTPKGLKVSFLPYLQQDDFDHLLWSCDLNFVRGEDSLVRALWAARPFVWQIYPQQDNAHHAKLTAFLDWMDAPESLRDLHRIWNALDEGPLPALDLTAWGKATQRACRRLLEQTDLTTQLLEFVNRITK